MEDFRSRRMEANGDRRHDDRTGQRRKVHLAIREVRDGAFVPGLARIRMQVQVEGIGRGQRLEQKEQKEHQPDDRVSARSQMLKRWTTHLPISLIGIWGLKIK